MGEEFVRILHRIVNVKGRRTVPLIPSDDSRVAVHSDDRFELQRLERREDERSLRCVGLMKERDDR